MNSDIENIEIYFLSKDNKYIYTQDNKIFNAKLDENIAYAEETPVLRREDLISILEALFKLSQEPNNAFIRKEDGLYVFDFYNLFKEHIESTTIHLTNEETSILHEFSIVDDVLHYKGLPIVLSVSDDIGNAIQLKPNGLYVPNLQNTLTNHINNDIIHVLQSDKNVWNSSLRLAKEYTDQKINDLVIYGFQIVDTLPIDISTIDTMTIYLKKEVFPETNEIYYVRYIFIDGIWIPLDLTNNSYTQFTGTKHLQETYLPLSDERIHGHDNKNVLDKFSEHDNRLYYNNKDIINEYISNDDGNGIVKGSDGGLYVKDLISELESITKQNSNGTSKTVLLFQECNDSGEYELEDFISNYNFLMIHYYLKPDDSKLDPYDAKMELLDVDSLQELYDLHIDYILEHDYGISTYNSKIRFYDNIMQITYYNHVCIYKIVGIR